jgi:LuxR family maltose regulon positive regulatory protein
MSGGLYSGPLDVIEIHKYTTTCSSLMARSGCLLDRLLHAAEDGARTGSVIEILALRALALQVQRASGEALATLERALTLAEPEGYVRTFVDEGAPMATLLRQMLRGRRQGERDQRRGALLGYARRLLAAFVSPASIGAPEHGWDAPGSGQPLPNLLTSREREVLELIAAGLSNKEVAARLFITPGTVKWYVNIIFKKLWVKTRTQAVAEAHKLGFLSE